MESIIKAENILIAESITDLECEISSIKQKLKKSDPSTPFTDSLNKSFYGGQVGFMSKKDNAKKSRELDKTIDAAKVRIKLNKDLKEAENRLKKLNTGFYIIRKNGLMVESVKFMHDKIQSLNKALKTGQIKGEKCTGETLTLFREMRQELKRKINQRKKQHEKS